MSRSSPLHDYCGSQAATFTTRGDWEIPDFYSSWEEEYRAATESAVLFDRTYRSRFRATGRDRVRFLQNMITNDVNALRSGEGCYAALLSRKGKLVSDLYVFRHDDALLLEMEPERGGPFAETLLRYRVSEDVDLEDISSRDATFAIAGPHAARLLSQALEEPTDGLAPFHFTFVGTGDVQVQVSAVRLGPGPGLQVSVPMDRAPWILGRLVAGGKQPSILPAGYRVMETRRIEAGIPLFGVDMDESHLILEADLAHAVSFTKGCYLGQEYVARLAHRGHLNRRRIGLKLQADVVPQRGDEVIGGSRQVGQVTSAATSPALGCPVAFAYVHRDFFEPGTSVCVRNKSGDLSARVTELPFLE